jgi:hypothetical protein
MKLYFKILLFVLVIFQRDINEANLLLFESAIAEISPLYTFSLKKLK